MIIGPIHLTTEPPNTCHKADRIKGRNRNATKPVADSNARFQRTEGLEDEQGDRRLTDTRDQQDRTDTSRTPHPTAAECVLLKRT